MTDLTTKYLGLTLRTPIVASAGPLTREVDLIRRLVDAGASAIVLPSLFEEEIIQEEVQLIAAVEAGTNRFAEALDYFPQELFGDYENPLDRYLAHLAAVRDVVDVPVIASLNATSAGAWTSYARLLADAGADAIELNLYHVAADPTRSGHDIENGDAALILQISKSVGIPVAVKISPYYSSLAHTALAFADAGAAGLVCFNRFYQPDLDPDTREVIPRVDLSEQWELRLPLRWIAILRPLLPEVSLAATTGISTGRDVAKALLVGADVAMMTSALLRHGPEHIAQVESELQEWGTEHEYDSVYQLRGSVSYASTDNPAAFERANYMHILQSYATPSMERS
ncbi:MAG TPA: dihydroorotate dehydrogenase-like protein [Ilumatobacteraceae bacterium]|nr:dihydroorotate dehydrogenase-like protein [Ilumatobacteraceae bacterium]